MAVVQNIRRSTTAENVLVRALRLGVSVTGLMLAGTALAPASAQVHDLDGVLLTINTLPFTEVTNGILHVVPAAGGIIYGGALTDSLGQLGLIKSGINTLTLTGSGLSTFAGDTVVSGNMLIAGAANVLSPNSWLSIWGQGVDLAGFDQTVHGLSGVGVLHNTGGAAIFTINTSVDTSFRGVISGNTQIVKNGTSVQSLNGANTYDGGTVLNGGGLLYSNNLSFGTGAITVSGASTLAPVIYGRIISNAIILDADLNFQSGGSWTELAGEISGAGQLTKSDYGNLAISNGANTFTGGTVLAKGGIRAVSGSLGSGIISVTAGAATFGSIDGVSAEFANDFDLTGNLHFELPTAADKAITLSGKVSGDGALYLKTGDGSLILNQANDYTGGTLIGSGTLGLGTGTSAGTGRISAGGATSAIAFYDDMAVANQILTGSSLAFDTRGFQVSLNGQISDKNSIMIGGINKVGAGSLTLTGTSTYTGATNVNSGTLNVTGSLGDTATTVASGASLTGTGSIAGPVTILDGGTIAPGVDGGGTLTLVTLTLNNSSTVNFDLGAANRMVSAFNDRIIVSGDLVLDGLLTVAQSADGSFTRGIYNLFQYGGLLTDNGLVIDPLPFGRTGTIQTSIAGQINLVVSASPVLLYWDGADGIGNGVISGGGGVWHSTSTNWTGSAPSEINANWVANGVAVFQTVGGTVDLTDSLAFSGLQFAADGYLLTASGGGALTTDTSSFISVDGGNTATISAPINGAGEIVKQGAGLLRLGGENGYQGGTQLTAGRIEVLSHKALGTGTLSMAGDTTLAAGISGLMLANAITTAGNASVDTAANIFTLDGQISGAGSLTKLGTGTLSLTGANTFTGGMTISAGTVTGAASNYGSGGIVNNAALIFNEAGDGSFGQVISGTGTVSKIGAGTLTIAAINTLTGPTTVTAGRLNVTGSLGSSAVTVQTGASLSGSGTVGPLIAQSGSVITPGSTAGAIATLAVNGAFTLAAGATLAVDVSPTLGGDRVAATGAASLAGNLVVTPATGPYTTFFQSYTLVSGSALTGTFATSALGSFGAPFVPVLVYNATSVTLRLTPNSLVTLGGVGLGGNGLVVAGAFDKAVAGGYNPQPFFNLYTQGTNLPTALSQLSGELHSAERRVALDDTRVVREAAFDRLNAGLSAIAGSQSVTTENAGKATTFWLRGAGSWGTAKADGIGSRFTTEQRGFLTGIDFASNGYTLGGLFHFTSTDVDLASLGKSKVESVGGAIYAGYRQENSGLAIGAGGSLASTKFDGARAITAPGLAQSLTSRADATTYQVFGEVAYDLASAENIRAEPYFRVAYARVDSNSMNEAGGSAAVFAGKQNNSLTLTTVGLRGAYNIGKATLSGSAGWQRTSGDRAFSTVLAITGVNRPHTVRSVAVDRDAVALEAQASFNLSSKVRLGAGYSGVIGSKNTDHGARATLTVGF